MLQRPIAFHVGAHSVCTDLSSMRSSGEWSDGPVRITRVLIIGNDETPHQQLQDSLEAHAMRVHTSPLHWNVIERHLIVGMPDVVVIDLPARGNDWIELLHRKRPRSSAPAIVAVGHADGESERVAALEVGADAYFTRPYGLRELVARIRAIVRRNKMGLQDLEREPCCRNCRFGGWGVDHHTRCLTATDGTQRGLTRGEHALLLAFLNAPECPLTREHLLNAIRIHEDVFDRTIDVRVLRLRRKLTTGRNMPQIIQTVRGVGYSLAASVEWM